MDSREVKFGEWIESGFRLYKENFGLVVLVSLIATLLSVASAGILAGPMVAGVCLITLKLYDREAPKPDVGMVFKGFNYFLNAFLFFFAWGVGIIIVSFLLSAIPCVGQIAGIFAAWVAQTLLMFGIFFIVDQNMEFWPASIKSYDNVKLNFWPFLGFFIIISIIGSIGALACGIGVVITAPIQICILTVAYRDIFKKQGVVRQETEIAQPAPEPLEEARDPE